MKQNAARTLPVLWVVSMWLVTVAAPHAAQGEAPPLDPISVTVSGVRAFGSDIGLDLVWTCHPEGFAALFRVERWDAGSAAYVDAGSAPMPGDAFSTADPAVFRFSDWGVDGPSPRIYRITVWDKLGRLTHHGPFRVELEDEALAPRAASAPPPDAFGIGQPGYRIKIPIRETGLYRLDAQTIADNLIGISLETATQFIAAASFSLSSQGREVAWMSDQDATAMLFYAVATNNRYTAENVYWVTVGDGTALDTRTGATPDAPVSAPLTYATTVRREVDEFAYPQFCMEADADFWFWKLVYSGLATWDIFTNAVTLDALGPDEDGVTGLGTLSVALRGASDIPANPEHLAVVTFNGQALASNAWNGFDAVQIDCAVTNLADGANPIHIQAFKTPTMGSSDYSQFMVDWFEVGYPRLYVGRDDALLCAGNTNSVVTIGGFTTGMVVVLDVSDWAIPVLVEDILVTSTDGIFSVTFDSLSPSNRYFACAAPAVRTPTNVRGRVIADLASSTNRARHVTIATPVFAAEAQDLAAYRRAQGLSASVVMIEDVFDLFSGGLFTPLAIRDFLAHALQTWDVAPRYVVLAGSGSYDYMNRRGFGDCVIPPAISLLIPYGLKASDAPLADLAGGAAPEVSIGRLHCQTTQEMAGVIAKIKAYEAESEAEWKRTVRFVADKLDPAAGDFTASCEAVAAYVATNYVVNRNYYDTQTLAQVNARIKSGINDGAFLISYFGHGSPDLLANFQSGPAPNYVLHRTELPAFTNAARAPIMAGMTCDLAYFGLPGIERLGEGLVARPQGGLSGLWGVVAPTYNHVSERLNILLHRRIFEDRDVRFGDAARHALTAYESEPGRWLPVLSLMAYLGDPATVIAPPGYAFADWRSRMFTAEELDDPDISGPLADPDGDGRVNLVEFAWNTNPTGAVFFTEFDASIVALEMTPGVTNTVGTVVFPRRKWREGYETRVEVCYDLIAAEWSYGNAVSWVGAVRELDDTMEEVTVHLKPPLEHVDLLFVRLRTILTE